MLYFYTRVQALVLLMCVVSTENTDVTNKQSFYPPLPKNMMLTNYAIMRFDLKIFNISQMKLGVKVTV